MDSIPLKVLIVDPTPHTSARLSQVLRSEQTVISASVLGSLDAAHASVNEQDLNAVYIDPLLLGIAATDEFIKGIRREKPEVVYVLYISFSSLGNRSQSFIFGNHPFGHYFKLDKDTPDEFFVAAVRRSIAGCQSDLSLDLTRAKIESLQEELRSLRRTSSAESMSIPLATVVSG